MSQSEKFKSYLRSELKVQKPTPLYIYPILFPTDHKKQWVHVYLVPSKAQWFN